MYIARRMELTTRAIFSLLASCRGTQSLFVGWHTTKCCVLCKLKSCRFKVAKTESTM